MVVGSDGVGVQGTWPSQDPIFCLTKEDILQDGRGEVTGVYHDPG